jgi:hypothetical protein
MVWLRIRRPDEKGVIASVLSELTNVNIALAESATDETGDTHEITLVCEPAHEGAPMPTSSSLKRRYQKKGLLASVRDYQERTILWQRPAVVRRGWLRDVAWRKEVQTHRASSGPDVDLTRAVVSADTSHRILRFVFPLTNARTLRIEHRDSPTVLLEIMNHLVEADLNVLSMVLRRGGARPKNAVLVAVCEPQRPDEADHRFRQAEDGLNRCHPRHHIAVRSHDGIDGSFAVTPREAETVLVRMPVGLSEEVRRIRRKERKPHQPAVFLSRRLLGDANTASYARAAIQAIEGAGGCLLEVALREAGLGTTVIYQTVMSHLWASDAGIILVSHVGGNDPIGTNIPYEYGFLQGQGKPALLLVEEGLDLPWTDIHGLFIQRFASGPRSVAPEDPKSIHSLARAFVAEVVADYQRHLI